VLVYLNIFLPFLSDISHLYRAGTKELGSPDAEGILCGRKVVDPRLRKWMEWLDTHELEQEGDVPEPDLSTERCPRW